MPVAVAALAVGHLPARLVVVGALLIAAATVRGVAGPPWSRTA